MEPRRSNQQVTNIANFQLVNNELRWNSGLNSYLAGYKPDPYSNKYKVVSIMGAQSTGKSTLLNELFKTSFQEMNSEIERSQTTKGIQVQQVPDSEKPFLVLDVEGSDSDERKGMGTTFEKMLCTFALAISDLIIVNMWTTDIGRMAGSSMQLLKNIIKMNIKLFGTSSSGKKKIIILLRDFGAKENLRQISKKFEDTIEKLLQEIRSECGSEIPSTSFLQSINYELKKTAS